MKVTYLGNVSPMISYGYDFTNGPVDIPETDKFAIKKYIGNGYFRCDHVDSFEFHTEKEPEQEVPEQEFILGKSVSMGIFKKKEDGNPYSRPEKVFRGEYQESLETEASTWLEERGIPFSDRIIMVK